MGLSRYVFYCEGRDSLLGPPGFRLVSLIGLLLGILLIIFRHSGFTFSPSMTESGGLTITLVVRIHAGEDFDLRAKVAAEGDGDELGFILESTVATCKPWARKISELTGRM